MKHKHGPSLFAFIILCSSFVSTEPLNPNPVVLYATFGDSAAVQLLDASYAAANKLDSTDRVFYLTYLTAIAANIESATSDSHRTKAWSNELFSLSFQMPIGHDRIATEKNALMQLSKVDPQSALDRLPQVEDPQPDPMGDFPEDVRADAAITIFPNYWRTSKQDVSSLKQIRFAVKHIANTGEYPYRAMGLVVQGFAAKLPDDIAKAEATTVLEEAIHSYQRKEEFKFQNRREEFLRLLQNTSTLVPNDLYKRALHIFVDQIMADKIRKENFLAVIGNSKKDPSMFTSSNKAFLFRAIPLIDQVDHDWAQELVRSDPEFAKANGAITYVKANVVLGNPTEQEVAKSHQEMLQRAGFASLWKTSDQSHPASAKDVSLVTNGEPSVIGSPKAGQEKLSSMVELVKSGLYPPKTKEFSDLAAAILDQGATLFEQAPAIRANRRPGFSALAEATEFCASSEEDWFVDRVQKLENETLKAYLLMYAAKGTAVAEARKSFLLPANRSSQH